MSQEAGIPFSAAHKQQAYKLLELPPELSALLESDNPPTLIIKASDSAAGYALLTSAEKTYQIRQKNTSNPIMVLQPSSTGPRQGEDAAAHVPVPSMCSVASIEDTLELVEMPNEEAAAPKKVNKWHEKFAKGRNTGAKGKH